MITPSGRREVPRRFVVETAERIEELGQSAPLRRPLAAVLRQRRAGSEESGRESGEDVSRRRDSRGARGHLSAELRSLAYHRAIAERLDEQVLLEARGRLQRLKDEGRIHPRYAEQWRQVLSRPLLEIASLITRETPEWRDLRQDTPFAGVLTERERRRLIESVR